MKPLPFLHAALAFWLAVPAWAEDLTLAQAKAKFAAADKALNEAYAKAKASLPDGVFAELQQDQREWITYRDGRSAEAAAYDGGAEEGKERENVEYWRSLADLTGERTAILGGWMKWDSFAHEWEGVWTDGHGGTLSILQSGAGEFRFVLDVVRGPTYHLGHIGGLAKWNGNTARFTADEITAEGETWLTFVKRGLKLEVIAENASGYHGARAYFDGHYLRIAELTEEDRRNILSPER